MQEKYFYTIKGVSLFCRNRALRLYPIYYVACLFSLGLIFLCGPQWMEDFHHAIRLPKQLDEIAQNLTMVFPGFFPNAFTPRLTPPTWAITCGLFFYFLIAMGASKTLRRAQIWFVISVAIHMVLLPGRDWGARYFSVPGAALPFSVGSLIYFYQAQIRDYLDRSHFQKIVNQPWICLLALSSIPIIGAVLRSIDFTSQKYHVDLTNYLMILFMVPLIAIFNNERIKNHSFFRFDKQIGTISYPAFLFHWQVAALVSWSVIGTRVPPRSTQGLLVFFLTVVCLVPLCWLVSTYVENPIEKIRRTGFGLKAQSNE